MKRSIGTCVALVLGVLLTWSARARHAEGAQGQDEVEGARIVLTRFDVNDTTLDIDFQITNDADHEIWVCDDMSGDFEVYLAEDDQTLVLRRRLDVETDASWPEPPLGHYTRLGPGEHSTESLSLPLPAAPKIIFFPELGQGTHARRVALEIGFYDESLPQLIRAILGEAEKFSAHVTAGNYSIIKRYFPGVLLREFFGSVASWNDRHEDQISHGTLLLPYIHQPRLGEEVLRAEINGVHILYKTPAWETSGQ